MNDNQELDESYEKARNYRVSNCLAGYAIADRTAIAEELAGLLRSEQEITREVRDQLADAIIRGCSRPEKGDVPDRRPRLEVTDTGSRGRLCKAILTRRRWCDAVEAELDAAEQGQKGTEVSLAIARNAGFDYEMMKKARQFHGLFLAEYQSADSDLMRDMCASGMDDILEGEDHYFCAQSMFIERVAGEKTGTSIALKDGEGSNSANA